MLPGARQVLRRIGRRRRRDHRRLPLHAGPGRRRVRARRRARAPAARASTPPTFRPDPVARAAAAPPLRPRRRAGGHLRVAAGRPQGPGPADPRAAVVQGPRSRRPAAARRRRPRRRAAAPAGRRAGRRRARGVHRRRARRRPARPPRRRRRLRPAVPHPRRRAGRRGPGHRAAGGVGRGRAGGRGRLRRRPGDRAGGRDRATSSAAATSARWSTRSPACSPTRAGAAAMGAAGREWMLRDWAFPALVGPPARVPRRRGRHVGAARRTRTACEPRDRRPRAARRSTPAPEVPLRARGQAGCLTPA